MDGNGQPVMTKTRTNTNELPQTGNEDASAVSMAGLIMASMIGLAGFGLRKKRDED